jgi:mannosyltransferase
MINSYYALLREKITALNSTWFLLSFIVGVGTILRIYHIDYQSLWYDELHSIIPTNPENTVSSIIEYCKNDQPPFFFLYLHFVFKIFGYNEIVGRASCAAIGILSIPAIYFLGKECGNKKTGLMSALLASVNYFHLTYSQELRFYSMLFLLTILSYLFFLRACRNPRATNFVYYVISTLGLLYTHYYGLVIFVVQGLTFVALAIFYRKKKEFITGGVISAVCVTIVFYPWMKIILNDMAVESFWIRKPDFYFIADYFYNYFGKDILLTLILITLVALFFKESDKNDKTFWILILWLALSYAVPYIRSVLSTPILHIRYTLITLPVWFVIFAIGWDRIRPSRIRVGLIIAIVFTSMTNLIFFRKYYTKITKQQFREASALVRDKNNWHYPILTNYPWHFNYYFRHDPDSANNLGYDLSRSDSFWLLQVEMFSPVEKKEELENFLGSFEVAERYNFYKTDVLLLKRKHQN